MEEEIDGSEFRTCLVGWLLGGGGVVILAKLKLFQTVLGGLGKRKIWCVHSQSTTLEEKPSNEKDTREVSAWNLRHGKK